MISEALPGRRPARVPDEDVDPAERLDRAVDEPREVGAVRHVTPYGERADAVGVALEDVSAPREHRHVGAFRREGFRGGQPEAGRGSADDRRPAAQTEFHRGGTVAGLAQAPRKEMIVRWRSAR